MNVRELISQLAGWDGDTEILIASDPEGNGFYQLYELALHFIPANSDKHGSVEEVYDAATVMNEGEETPSGFEPRLVLWP